MTTALPEDLVGRVLLGRYRVVRSIGRGGMGSIWLARSEGAAGFVRPVVIKRILPERLADPHLAAMFAREARIMANLRHPGIVSVLEYAVEEGSALMVLDWVHGYHLGHWRKYVEATRGLFPVLLAVEILVRTLEALHYAHTQRSADGTPLGIVHRDVTPSNILIDVEGHVKLADFGVARMQHDHTEVSSSPSLKGKLSFLSPEVCRLEPATPRSDVYSAGVTLHEVLSGRNEFRGLDPASTITKVLFHLPTPLHLARTDVPDALAMTVLRALAKEPAERFGSAAELADALRQSVRDLAPGPPIAEMAARDFGDPRIAAILDVEPLSVLDRSWRETTSPRAASGSVRAPVGEEATFEESPSSAGGRGDPVTVGPGQVPSPPSDAAASVRRRTSWIVPAVVAAIVATFVVALGSGGRESERPAVVVVTPDPAPAHPPPAGPELRPVPQEVPGEPRPPARPGAAVGAGGSAGALTRSFARHVGEVTRCIDASPGDVPANAAVSLRFRVARDGSVESAELLPAGLSATTAGACILRVARATRFDPQREPVTFRIPITLRPRPRPE